MSVNVSHINGSTAIYKPVEHPVAFILVNDRKDFATFYGTPQSRYEGFFAAHGDSFVKTVSRIVKDGEPTSLQVYSDQEVAVRRYGLDAETYSLMKKDTSIVYEGKYKD